MKNKLNEDKIAREQRQDARKKKRAERKLKKAETLYDKGKDKRAERKVKKAEKLVSDIDSLKTDSLKKEISDIKKIDYSKEFDILSSILGNSLKIKDFEYFKRFKIKGDDISREETMNFINTVSDYIKNNYDDIRYLSDNTEHEYNGFEIEVIARPSKILFRYKEGIFDKVKLYIKKNEFTKSNKEDILKELEQLSGSKTLKHSIDKRDDKKNDTGIEPPIFKKIDKVEDNIEQKETQKIIQKTNEFLQPDNSFINNAVKILIEEELFKGALTDFTNVNEDKIFNYFVTNNSYKTLNPSNIDAICRLYAQKATQTNESIIDAAKRSVKGLIGKKTEGFVKDMIYAFNTDVQLLTSDMNKMLGKMSIKYSKKIENEILDEINQNKKLASIGESKIYEEFDATDASKAAEQLNKNKNKKKLIDIISRLTRAGNSVPKKGALSSISKIAGKKAGIRLGTKLIGKVALRTLLLPLTTVPLAGWILGAAIEGVAFWYKMDEQQNQIATIFTLMYLSQSTVFLNELAQAGVRITDKKIELDIDMLENKIADNDNGKN